MAKNIKSNRNSNFDTNSRQRGSSFEPKLETLSGVSPTFPTERGSFANAMKLIAEKNYEAAIKALGKPSGEEIASNTLGVCLMRAGRAKEAVDLFRRMVLLPGSTLVRENINPIFVRNYTVALVLVGLPGAVKMLLSELPETDHPMALQIQQAIKNWSKSLPLLRRLDWYISGISPENCVIPLEFEPGELYFLSQTRPVLPGTAANPAANPAGKLAV